MPDPSRQKSDGVTPVSSIETTLTPDLVRATPAPPPPVGNTPALPRRHLFLWVVALAALLVAVAFADATRRLARTGGRATDLGWTAAYTDEWRVAAITRPEIAGLLQPGDRVIDLDGVPPIRGLGLRLHRHRIAAGARYRLTVDRAGERYTFDLGTTAGPTQLPTQLTYLIVSLVWCLIGLAMGAARPDLAVARLAMAVAVAVGMVFLNVGVTHLGPLWAPLHVVLGYHFFARFPTGGPITGLWRVTLWLLYAIGGLAGGIGVVFTALILWSWPHAAAFPQSLHGVGDFAGLLGFVGSIVAMAAVLPRNYRRLSSADQQRRVKWVFYAGIVALVPQLWYSAVSIFERVIGPTTVPRLDLVANMAPVVVPIAVAYAVVKHRIFDTAVVIRLGVQYMLAKRALQALLLLPAIALAATAFAHRDRTLVEIATESTGYVYWMAAAGVGLRFRRPIRSWLDQRFFREEFDREQMLVDLVAEISRADSIADVSRRVSDKIEAALHPKTSYLWYRDPAESALSSASHPELSAPSFSPGPWVSWLELHASALALPPPAAVAMSADELRWFAERQITLIVPIADSHDRLVGALLLGEKRSEEPYSARDRQLLEAVARQTAAARENLRLRARVREDARIRHDVLSRLDATLPDLLKECPRCGACYDGAVSHCPDDDQPLTLTLPVARTVDGKYRLDRLIGRGGMGMVYEARDLRLERVVAVKIMLGRAFGHGDALRRFHREARAVARLNHPNIVGIYDFGPLPGEGAYLVMERVSGATLRAALQRSRLLPPAEAAAWFDPLLQGLAAAHEQGIVHRDLKPENIVGRGAGGTVRDVKILDFGLAKLQPTEGPVTDTATVHGMMMGTLGYMSPEQIQGGAVDQRTDVFAVGVMIFETLTGRRPFEGKTATDLARAVLQARVQLPLAAGAAVVLDRVVQRCLAKDPAGRYHSAEELRRELIPALRDWPRIASTDAGA